MASSSSDPNQTNNSENNNTKTNVWQRIWKRDSNNDSNMKEKLAKMGLAAALSYGWVSNMSYGVSVSLAWYIFSKRVSATYYIVSFILPFL